MPLDDRPTADGNVYVKDGKAHVIRKLETPPLGRARFTSHWATCPSATEHRAKPEAPPAEEMPRPKPPAEPAQGDLFGRKP